MFPGSMVSIVRNFLRRALRSNRHRLLLIAPWIIAALISPGAFAAPNAAEPCRLIVVGYTGGTETPNYSMSGIVQIRDRLDTDPQFPPYFEQESSVLPRFYKDIVRQDLGSLMEWLPEDALYHDPNAYLRAERSRDVAAFV